MNFHCVGRDAELGLIDAALQAARSGAAQVVMVSGQAGIGKTYLLEALQARGMADELDAAAAIRHEPWHMASLTQAHGRIGAGAQ